jgi:SHS2 domain-containing protein
MVASPTGMDGEGQDRPAGHEIVEHTADIGLRVWAPNLEGLFEQAALGMLALVIDPTRVRAERAEDLAVDANDLEEALIAWLQEILYRLEVHHFVPARVEVLEATPRRVRARLEGESFDRERHETRMDIKAATYHDLSVRREVDAGGTHRWCTTVIFDI